MTPIEIILGIAALLAGAIAFLAHRDHLSFTAEANKQLAAVKADANTAVAAATADVAALKTKVAVLETKIAGTAATAAPPSTTTAAKT